MPVPIYQVRKSGNDITEVMKGGIQRRRAASEGADGDVVPVDDAPYLPVSSVHNHILGSEAEGPYVARRRRKRRTASRISDPSDAALIFPHGTPSALSSISPPGPSLVRT